jgi:hypothetical protein
MSASEEASPASKGTHRSIVGKVVADDAMPTHTMEWARPVPISDEVRAEGFDKKAEEGAACSLRNISKKETKRRQRISNVGLLLSIIGTTFFIAKDKEIPRFSRLVMSAPFGLWIGFLLSAKAGI